MTQHFIEVPDALSLTRNPAKFRIATDLGPNVRQMMALYAVDGYATEKIYEERRISIRDPSLMYISFGASATDYDFSAVLDDELSAEVPPISAGNYLPLNVCREFVPFTPEVAADETSVATVITGASAVPIGYTLAIGTWYRITAAYIEGYSGELTDALANELEIFGEGSIVWNGSIHCMIKAEFAFENIETTSVWEVEIYEMPDRAFHALKGGWDWRDFPDRASLLPEGRRLLSAMPNVRSWWLDQKAWVGFLPISGIEYSIDATVEYEDGTFSLIPTLSLGIMEAFAPLLADISDAGLGYSLLNPAKTIRQVVVAISADGFAETVTLISSYRNAPFRREFHFTNSLGGCDWLISYGKGQATEGHEAEEYEKHVPSGYSLSENVQYAAKRMRPRQSFAVSSGYRSKAERNAAKELLYAEKAFIREDDLFVPIVVTASDIQDEPDGDYRYKLSFEYKYAFDKISSR